MAVLLVVGLVMKAACRNVETYAAAQTIYWLGHTGLGYTINVLLADGDVRRVHDDVCRAGNGAEGTAG